MADTDTVNMLKIRNLKKKFGNYRVLEDMNMEIKAGALYGFVGPNGAGKTTTIRIMSGLLLPDAGEVEIDGVDAIREPERVKEKFGYVPDHFGVYDNLKVSEYMEFFASCYGMEGLKARKRAEILLEQVLGERTARLQLEGFTVKILGGPCHGTVRTDIQYLNRVLDNLMVNVEKHADRSKPVVVLVETEAKNLRISVTNAVPSIPNPTASTKIGLKSSEKIMEQMEGSLKAERVEHKFIAEVTLPLTDK